MCSRIWRERLAHCIHNHTHKPEWDLYSPDIETASLDFFQLYFSDAASAAEGDVFGLNGQIEHKMAFLRKHVPRETSLVLVGHSIGCYIILELMKRNPELKVCHDISQSACIAYSVGQQ